MKYLRVILIVLLLACCTLMVASHWNIEYLPPHGELGINLFSGRIGINNFNGDIVNRGFGIVEVHGSHTFWWPIFSGNLDHRLWFFDCALWLPTLLLALPLATSASPWARRRRRAKQGLCIRCGYDLRGTDHTLCPECGTEVRTGQPRMKRLQVILLFLLLGAMVNAAVAWGCAAWVLTPATSIQTAWVSLPGLRKAWEWNLSRKDAFGATQLVATVRVRESRQGNIVRVEELLPAWSDMKSQMDEAAEEARRETNKPENASLTWPYIAPRTLMQKAYGFPSRSMYWNWASGIRKENTVPHKPLSSGLTLQLRARSRIWPMNVSYDEYYDDHRAMPLGIIPFGFAINTIFYASLVWLLIPGPFALRRLIRIKRGLCVKCAYDLRGAEHDACPECGRKLLGTCSTHAGEVNQHTGESR